MFSNKVVTAMVPAADLDRAIRWYADALGLEPASTVEGPGAGYQMAEGTRFFIYETQFAGTAQHTILSFDTDDIHADMAALRARGVVFEDYDFPGLKTENGLAEFGEVKNAWFKDSEGNIIALVQGM